MTKKWPWDFKLHERVIYVPNHADGNPAHPDCEHGKVSSSNHKFVFVRFDKEVENSGWDNATGKACDPSNLICVSEMTPTKEG
jgi:hypothetical protein